MTEFHTDSNTDSNTGSHEEAAMAIAKSRVGMTKWIVIGILGLAFLMLYRSNIGLFIEKIGMINWDPDKGLKIVTVQTPIGTLDVSNQPLAQVVPVQGAGAQTKGLIKSAVTHFKSDEYGFTMDWPDNAHWQRNFQVARLMEQSMGAQVNVAFPLAIVYHRSVGKFRPNVNVVVEPISNMSFNDYIDAATAGLIQMGSVIISQKRDPKTNAALIVSRNSTTGQELYQVQRIVVRDSRSYVVTASQLPADDALSRTLRAELMQILNSFRVTSV